MTSTKCFPKQKFKGKSVWYSTVPLGHNKLNSMVKIMMSEAGVEGYYTVYCYTSNSEEYMRTAKAGGLNGIWSANII